MQFFKNIKRIAEVLTGPGENGCQLTEEGIHKVNHYSNRLITGKKRKEWRKFMETLGPYPDQFSGRGIVICAGGLAYFTCAWVNVNMLRAKGCTLPIEIWHDDNELTAEAARELGKLNVVCKNYRKYTKIVLTDNYQIKPLAILYSSFKEVLYLDADNTCLRDPAYLFEHPSYRAHGAVFWPDFWVTSPDNPIWQIVDSKAYYTPEQESGQLLINKAKCWKELSLCLYYNLNPQYYYKILHGDKDTFRFAWIALRTSFHMIQKGVGLCGLPSELPDNHNAFYGTAMVQHDYEGNILFVHNNSLKWHITKNGETVWQQVRRFREGASNKKFIWRKAPEYKKTFLEIQGDIETISGEQALGNFESECLEVLERLRNYPFYSKFMQHVIFSYYR